MLARIGVLERDNMRFQGLLCVERDRIDSLQRHMSYTQGELRRIRGNGNGGSNGNGNGNGNENGMGGGNGDGNPNINIGEPTRLQDAIRIANNLMDQKLKGYVEDKRRFDRNQRYTVKDCKAVVTATAQRALEANQQAVTYYVYGEKGYYRSKYPKLKNKNYENKNGTNEARGKAYALGGGETNLDSNIVTDVSYAVELAGERVAETDVILRGYTLGLLGHPFNIDLIPIELGSFDVIISMDWMAKYHAVIICDEKIVRIPYGNEILIIQRDGSDGGITGGIHGPDESGVQTVLDKFVIIFIDDILIYSKSKKEHYGHLKLILELLKKEEFKGIHVDPAKIKSIKSWASPKTPTETRQFLGLAEEVAFQMLKQKPCSAVILDIPEGSENFVLYCDASHKGLGAVLMQREKVIAYASRQLKIHEKNYTTYDLKLRAVVFALNMWIHYMYGTNCVVFTNHKSLQHILESKELNMRQRRWLELLSDYDCEIRYHPKKENVVADALSRKERIKLLKVQALVMIIGLNLLGKIFNAQAKARKKENFKTEDLSGMIKKLEPQSDRTLCLKNRS
nr:putative reverse transcriptase domain-containing protein [Tanacetum cinerariifolium]